MRNVWMNTGTGWQPATTGTWVLPEDFVILACGFGDFDNGLRLVDLNGDRLPDLVRAL